MQAGVRAIAVGALLSGLLGPMGGCERDRRAVTVPASVEDAEGRVVVEGDSPPLERRGAVMTVVTAVGQGAPAGTRDQVALIRLTLSSAAWEDHLDLPIGGAGVLTLPETERAGSLQVEVFSPTRETVGFNQLDLGRLSGSISVVALEVSSRPPNRLCDACSVPEPLTELRGLPDTQLFWSSGSWLVSGTAEDELLVAVRVGASAQERRALFEAAGARVVESDLAEEPGVLWVRLRPTGTRTTVDMALTLARHAMVKGFAVADVGEWPSFWR